MTIEIRPWSTEWATAYERAATDIKATLGDHLRVEHVGSTAVEGLPAKPIIDLLIGLATSEDVTQAREQLERSGWIDGRSSGDVSAFLQRRPLGDKLGLNAHLVVHGDNAWKDILAFRDWLRVHPQHAEVYDRLKCELADVWRDDLEAYTKGKDSFIRETISRANLVDITLQHQRDALGRAVALRCVSIALQLTIAVSAMLSVLSKSPNNLVILAGLTLLLVITWVAIDRACRRQLSNGEQARRLIQIEYGLAERVEERSLITEAFSPLRPSSKRYDIGTNFATRAPPGTRRLAEMIDESAFFSASVQNMSAIVTAVFLVVILVVTFLGFLFLGPRIDGSLLTTAVRMFMAFAVFLLSADVIGAAIAHGHTAAAMEKIRMRISAARGRQFPQGDVLQAMIDHNAAVEGAPPPLPFVYELIQAELVAKWEAHKAHAQIGM